MKRTTLHRISAFIFSFAAAIIMAAAAFAAPGDIRVSVAGYVAYPDSRVGTEIEMPNNMGSYRFDEATKTLYCKNLNLTDEHAGSGIAIVGPTDKTVTIKFLGNNLISFDKTDLPAIDAAFGDPDNPSGFLWDNSPEVIIESDNKGTITLNAPATRNSLFIPGKIVIREGKYVMKSGYATIYSRNNITIEDGVNLTTNAIHGYGIMSEWETVSISGKNTKVDATALFPAIGARYVNIAADVKAASTGGKSAIEAWTAFSEEQNPAPVLITIAEGIALVNGTIEQSDGCMNDGVWMLESWTSGESVIIAKQPEAPAGISPVSPSYQGAKDGKLTGTTVLMEYSADELFTSPVACTDGEVTALAPGKYYVRLKATAETPAGKAVMIEIAESTVEPPAEVKAGVEVLADDAAKTEVSAADAAKAISCDIKEEHLEADADGKIVVKADTAARAAESAFEGQKITSADVKPLPVFTATKAEPEKPVARITLMVKGEDFGVTDPAKARIVKILAPETGKALTYATEVAGDMDGKFQIVNADGTQTSTIDANSMYKLYIYIRDDGAYDLNKAPGTVADPLVIVKNSVAEADPKPAPDTDNGGTGGCNTGLAGIALLALIPLVTRRKK